MLLLASEEANQKKQGEEEAGPACAEPAAEEGSRELKIKGYCVWPHVCETYLSIAARTIFIG